MSAPPPMPENSQDTEQIRLLVIFHYILAGLSLAGLLFLVLHFLLMTSVIGLMKELPQKVVVPPPIKTHVEPAVVLDPTATPDQLDQTENAEPLKTEEFEEFNPEIFEGFFNIFAYFYVVIGVFILLGAILNFMSARYLGQRRRKVFSMVTAGVNCLSFPFGTVLGVFTFVVLSRPSVEASYRKNQ
jgi:hypothetical protein